MTTVTNSLLLPISKKLCKKILQLRKELRLTQNDLSKKCFCSKTALSAYETGKRKVTLHFVLALAELSHYDIDSIISCPTHKPSFTSPKSYRLTLTALLPVKYLLLILLGRKNGKRAIYVGMSKQLQKRLKQHVNTAPDGIVWDRAIAIAAVDKHFLAGTGSEYLEADLYQKALNTNNLELANLTPVVYPSCPTVDKVAYDNFLEEVYLLIELAGYDIFKTITDLVPPPAPATIFIFQIDKYPAMAEQISRKEFILKKGAKIADKPLATITNKQVARLRKKFQAFINPEYFTISDIQFDSANAAAIFIVAYKFGGKKQWKNAYGERPK